MKAAVISLGSVSSLWTIEAMKKYFDSVDDINVKYLEVRLSTEKGEILYKSKPLDNYDCIYVKGSFRYEQVLRSVALILSDKTYMPIKPYSFTFGHDKLLTQLKLQQQKIPMPRTYIASTPVAAKEILKKINYPVVMKFPQGTQGKGVMFADSFASASSMLDALVALKQPFLIQEYIETSGTDTRVIVVGDKVVAAMKRKAVSGEKRANIHAGAVGEAYEPDNLTKRIAVKAAQAIGAEICAIDVLAGVKGPLVIEVNLSPGLQGITKATKINVADYIAKYLFKKTKEFKAFDKKQKAADALNDLGISNGSEKEIVSTLDFRGNRILMPEIITNLAGFDENDEVIFKIRPGQLTLKKFSDKEEKKRE